MMLPGYYPRVVRSLGDFFGSNPVEVQVLLLGLRGMEPYRRIPIANPCVEVELTGALPLFPGQEGPSNSFIHLVWSSVHSFTHLVWSSVHSFNSHTTF